MRTVAFLSSLIFVFVLPMETVVFVPGLGSSARIAGLLVAGTWLVAVATQGRIRKPRLVHVVIFVFFVWNAFSIFWSQDSNMTAKRIQTFVQTAVMIMIIWDLYTTQTALKAGLQAYVLGAYVAIGGTIYNYLNAEAYTYGRYSAAGMHVVNLGLILALAIPIAWYLAVSAGSTSRLSWGLRILNFCYLPAAYMGIALTASRGALVASFPAVLFVLSTLTRLRLYVRVLFFVGLLGMLFSAQAIIPQNSLKRLGTTYMDLTEGDLTGRVGLWREGFALSMEHPILGIGSNAYETTVELGKVAHNTFLSVLVELGIIGLIIFLTILGMVAYHAIQQPKLESRLWLTVLFSWALGASALTYEDNKPTWLFLSFIVVSASLFLKGDRLTHLSDYVPRRRGRNSGGLVP